MLVVLPKRQMMLVFKKFKLLYNFLSKVAITDCAITWTRALGRRSSNHNIFLQIDQ